jgi:DNA-binding SARP family transcriptional activator
LEADEAASCILFNDGCYCLNPDIPLWIDSEAFSMHYQAGQQSERQGLVDQAIEAYEAAADLYEGEFLAEDIYEDWTLAHREHLKYIHLSLLDQLSQHYYKQEQFARSMMYSQRILAHDNCREDAHRRLMRCYQRQGQRHLALRQYHRCMEALKSELDVPPMPATTRLYEMIRQEQTHFPDA